MLLFVSSSVISVTKKRRGEGGGGEHCVDVYEPRRKDRKAGDPAGSLGSTRRRRVRKQHPSGGASSCLSVTPRCRTRGAAAEARDAGTKELVH